MRIKNIWIVSILALFLVSCSKLSMGVLWADTFVMSSIDDYFVLSSDQARQARAEFKEILREVRREEFPRLAELLEQFSAAVESGQISEEKLEQWMMQTQNVIRLGLGRFEPLGQRLIAEQAAAGFSRFDREFEKKYEKRQKQLLNEKERRKLADKTFDRILGETVKTLNSEQKVWLEELVATSPPPLLLQQESRKYVFEKFKILRETEEDRKKFISTYFSDWAGIQSEPYQEARAAHQQQLQSFFLRVLRSASEEQKQNLMASFRGRAKELRDLAN